MADIIFLSWDFEQGSLNCLAIRTGCLTVISAPGVSLDTTPKGVCLVTLTVVNGWCVICLFTFTIFFANLQFLLCSAAFLMFLELL